MKIQKFWILTWGWGLEDAFFRELENGQHLVRNIEKTDFHYVQTAYGNPKFLYRFKLTPSLNLNLILNLTLNLTSNLALMKPKNPNSKPKAKFYPNHNASIMNVRNFNFLRLNILG